MSKTIDILLSQARFPSTCVVCMSPASQPYSLEKTFSRGRRSYTVKVKVPMCDSHFEAASLKGTAENVVEVLGVIGGILAGLFAAIILMVRWRGAGEGNILLQLFAGSVFGLGIFLIVWAVVSLSVAQQIAEPQSKEARNPVRITHYWPGNQVVRLEFQNESLAERLEKEGH